MSTRGGALAAVLLAALALITACAGPPAPGGGNLPLPQGFPDVAYGTASPSQTLDLWMPTQGAAPHPLVVYVHGGGFEGGDKRDIGSKVSLLLQAGYAVASVDYRLSGEAPFPAAARDVQTAVRRLRAEAGAHGIDPTRIALWGESAGANLAALVGIIGDRPSVLDDPSAPPPTAPATVQAVVEWYGPTAFAAMAGQSAAGGCPARAAAQADGYVRRYLGAEPGAAPAVAAQADPVAYVPTAPSLPPFAIAHGSADCLIPPAQALVLADALRGAGASPALFVADGFVHADPRFDTELSAPTIAWLNAALRR